MRLSYVSSTCPVHWGSYTVGGLHRNAAPTTSVSRSSGRAHGSCEHGDITANQNCRYKRSAATILNKETGCADSNGEIAPHVCQPSVHICTPAFHHLKDPCAMMGEDVLEMICETADRALFVRMPQDVLSAHIRSILVYRAQGIQTEEDHH